MRGAPYIGIAQAVEGIFTMREKVAVCNWRRSVVSCYVDGMRRELLTCNAMAALNVEVQRRLPRIIVLMLSLAEYVPLESVLRLTRQTLLDQSVVEDGWVLMGEKSHGPVFWLPKPLANDVCDWRWNERRKRPIHGDPPARTDDDILRMFSRGRWLHRQITAPEVFGIIARAIRSER
jgi:hypothetical protein